MYRQTSPDVRELFLASSDEELLLQFVTAARSNVSPIHLVPPRIDLNTFLWQGVKASASIGGWAGSQWYSSNVGSPENRTSFVKTVTDFAEKYGLDGIDFECVCSQPPISFCF